MDDEVSRWEADTTPDGTNDNASDPGGSDNNDDDENDTDSDPHDPMNSWEEFDADAAYQKKHVDPEMRQWILTRDCRRIISDKFFNNPVHNQGVYNPPSKNRADCVVFRVSIGLVLRQLYTEKEPHPPLRINLRHPQLS
jgi:hypothetical protein